MREAIVISGNYKNRIGKATEVNSYGNVMFYPIEGQFPYRVCLPKEDVEWI